MPALQLLQAWAEELAVGSGEQGAASFERTEAVLARLELGIEAAGKISPNQAAHLEVGGEEFGGIVFGRHLLHGAHFPQGAEALADRALAQVEARADVSETERGGGGEYDAVDRGQGLRHAEKFGRTDEEIDDVGLEGDGGRGAAGRDDQGSRLRPETGDRRPEFGIRFSGPIMGG